jgi:hypothetical protein
MDSEEVLKLVTGLEEAKRQYVCEHNRVAELEEQLAMIAQENQKLQSRLAKMDTIDEMKSVHEELSILEEVRFVHLPLSFQEFPKSFVKIPGISKKLR